MSQESLPGGGNDEIGRNWDKYYSVGKYAYDQPLPITQDIIDYTKEHLPEGSRGLYVGCGNGRNFIPMLESGLKLDGTDLSQEGIDQVRHKLPAGYEGTLQTGDFHDLAGQWDYLISIQVFQFGKDSGVHFAKAVELLRPGGLLFLRVHSASTDLALEHTLEEGHEGASRTVFYKNDQTPIHYFEHDELVSLSEQTGFLIKEPLREVSAPHPKGKGHYSYWETILERAA